MHSRMGIRPFDQHAESAIYSNPAAPFTLGVEEEYQLVDPVTGALRSHASQVRAADWTGDIAPELQETTIEIGTPICSTTEEVHEQLTTLRFRAATVSASSNVTLVAAGLHPFSRWEGHRRPDEARYQQIERRYGRIAKDEHIFGMHVHVAVPPELKRLQIMNVARHLLPHLLALSASSPFFEGADTSFASFRTILWRRWPTSGIPPRFRGEADYELFVQALLDSGTIQDRKNLYWSLRAHPTYPTLEFRVMDMCPSVTDAVAVAALARCIVVGVVEGVLEDRTVRRLASGMEQEILRVNEWRVAHEGLDAQVVDALAGCSNFPLRDSIRRLLERLLPVAQRTGDDARFADIETILARGNAADRMRELFLRGGDMTEVVEWLAVESLVGTGLDRRKATRELV